MLITNQPTEPQESYRSLEEIRLRKEMILRDIRKDDGQIRKLWGNLFSKPTMLSASTPSRRFSGLMSTGAGILDGLILGWKLYRKFTRK
ncbi:MAG: hypothetical protein MSD82_11780 [Prevotella sp.]|nr:hypothetical protein [Prevotella sp.]